MDEAERLARRLYAREWRAKNIDKERERIRLQAAERRAADREAYNAAMRAWRKENPEKQREYQRRSFDKNRVARNAYMREWHQRNRERVNMQVLSRKHGIPVADLYAMLEGQKRRCAICKGVETSRGAAGGQRSLHLDHDHATGRVRGFLCGRCNQMLGAAQDDPKRLRAAIRYLGAAQQ